MFSALRQQVSLDRHRRPLEFGFTANARLIVSRGLGGVDMVVHDPHYVAGEKIAEAQRP